MIILYVVSTLERCGPTNQLFGIVKNLDRQQFTPVVLTLSPEGHDSRWEDFVALGVDVQTLGLGRAEGLLKGAVVLRKRVASIAPDLLHTQGLRADSMCVRLFAGHIPQVATLRNYPFKDYVMSFGFLQGQLMARWHLHHLRQVSAVALVSNAIKAMVGVRLPHARVVQNGVDMDRYRVLTLADKARMRETLGLPAQVRVFMSAGLLDQRKDPQTLVEGFLAAAREDDLLLMLGDGVLRESLQARYEGCKQVRFLGHVGNVQAFLQSSDYFISTSLAEGLPNSVLEALACGLPCLLSDIAEHGEIIGKTPLAHLLFTVAEDEAMAQCLRALCDTRYEAERAAAVEIIKAGFSAARMSKHYQYLYRELLA